MARKLKIKQQRGWAYTLAATILEPILLGATKRHWIDEEKVPTEGGCVVVLNHVTKIDPLTAAHLVYYRGRLPRYLAKSSLFKNKAMAKFMTAAGQIPVERLSSNAAGAFDAAVAAIEQGELVVVYPEGSITRDPDLWPMRGKSGAARIALATGCPVIPIAQWGAHEILAPYSKRPKLFPRKTITMKVGEPVLLEDLRAEPLTSAAVNEATDRIMAAITALLEDVRGAKAPAERFDPRQAGVSEIGKPKDRKSGSDDSGAEGQREGGV
ncbi:lysophospholipid acyltransferase family protein [Nocardioides speluncae]|uniref:lysophospholipid acyltransferase family protein n=1 Tax=Nocardioides speluncae TaxID=2670337 RepID=UPI000D697F13|nr:lysophospholipid acyltransferase family protein [Nocardioides speluncae]